jgi:hypothetical protein
MNNTVKITLLIILGLISASGISFAHCDTMDGPVIKDAQTAIKENNVNYALKWVNPSDEKEVTEAFTLMMNVRPLSPNAKMLAEKYFFETLVRLHRTAEGVPYTGIKPAGSPVDKKILAADQSIALGNLSPMKDLVPVEQSEELTDLFNKLLSLKNFEVDNVSAGREYVKAYVMFLHFAEADESGHTEGGHHI